MAASSDDRRLGRRRRCPRRPAPRPGRCANHALPGSERDAAERQPAANDVGELDRDEHDATAGASSAGRNRERERDEGELGRHGVAGADDEVHARPRRASASAQTDSAAAGSIATSHGGAASDQQHAGEREAAAQQHLGPALARAQRREAPLQRRLHELLLFEGWVQRHGRRFHAHDRQRRPTALRSRASDVRPARLQRGAPAMPMHRPGTGTAPEHGCEDRRTGLKQVAEEHDARAARALAMAAPARGRRRTTPTSSPARPSPSRAPRRRWRRAATRTSRRCCRASRTTTSTSSPPAATSRTAPTDGSSRAAPRSASARAPSRRSARASGSLQLPAGSAATSPAFCVDERYPHFRVTVGQLGRRKAKVRVSVVYPGLEKNVRKEADVDADDKHPWKLSKRLDSSPTTAARSGRLAAGRAPLRGAQGRGRRRRARRRRPRRSAHALLTVGDVLRMTGGARVLRHAVCG